MSANIQETRLCLGFHKQSALHTALAAADCWTLSKTNPALFAVNVGSENNGPWIGKNDEFPTANYLTNWDVSGPIEGYLGSEWLALLGAFGFGKVSKAAAGTGFTYTCTPLDPVADGIEMPSLTVVEAIRQGASSVLDRALVGVCCEEFAIQLNSGPGLQNARFTSQWVGCGKVVEPSTIVVPAESAQHLLRGGSAAIAILANDYVTAKTFANLEFRWKNNLRQDTGFYPGSGSANGAQIRGRMEHGVRECSLSFSVRFAHGSTELSDFLAQTEGTAVISLTGEDLISVGIYHAMTLTLHRATIRSAVVGDTDGIVTVAVELLPMTHSVNGLVTLAVTCAKDEILTAAA
jgi:hypothetical protein